MQYFSNLFDGYLGGYQKITNESCGMDGMTSPPQQQSQSNTFGISSLSNTIDVSTNNPNNNTMNNNNNNHHTPLQQTLSTHQIPPQRDHEYNNSLGLSQTSWFNALWSTHQQDEMNTIYDIESQTTMQISPHDTLPHEQSLSSFQRFSIQLFASIQKKLPKAPELTYTQKLTSFVLFSIGGIFLLFNALINFSAIFLGGANKFAISLSMSNIFFIIASLFITSPSSHFQPHRRFTTTLYLTTILLTVLASIYLPYFIIVIPLLLAQLTALIFHVLSFFTSAVNVNMNIGQAIVTSIFQRAL